MKAGDKIKMDGERQRYTVMACDKRYAILVKPFNAERTYLYCITDLEHKIRGRCDLIFGLPFPVNTPGGARRMLALLKAGETCVSRRRRKRLEQKEIDQLNGGSDKPPR